MGKFQDLTGKQFGRLYVIQKIGENKHRKSEWLCKCDCGNTTIVTVSALKSGNTKSCGCLRTDVQKNREKKKYKGERNRIYNEWRTMKSRCSSGYRNSENYIGRGITVCREWLGKDGFQNFCDWAESSGYQDNLTLDRIDNDKGYSPDNCRWATQKEQQNNKRNNVLIEYMGETKTMAQWCEILGINYSTVKERRKRGITIPELFKQVERK